MVLHVVIPKIREWLVLLFLINVTLLYYEITELEIFKLTKILYLPDADKMKLKNKMVDRTKLWGRVIIPKFIFEKKRSLLSRSRSGQLSQNRKTSFNMTRLRVRPTCV